MNPLKYPNPEQVAALKRIEDIGACVGQYESDSVHVEMSYQIDINDTHTEAIVDCVNMLGNVYALDISQTRITDRSSPHLARLRGIRGLLLGGEGITDASMPHVALISTLKELVLSGTSVTDTGLKHLARLSDLRFVQLFETAVTDIGAGLLASRFPRIEIER